MRQLVLLTAALLVLTASAASAAEPICNNDGKCVLLGSAAVEGPRAQRAPRTSLYVAVESSVQFISNPSGCGRTRLSCACRLAAAWDLGPGLDATKTWLRRFARASGPGPRVAAYRPGHIMGIVGAEGDGYRVVDYNSGGHRNRTYVVSRDHLRRYTLLDTRARLAHLR